MALASVLLPNYNNASFLKEAIDSVLNQSFTDFELVIIDDGSTDNSIEIIKSYADSRVILIEKEKNSGIVDSLNLGLKHCNKKYILRMDGDDISVPDRFEKLVTFMEKHPQIGVCSSSLQLFGALNEVRNVDRGSKRLKAGMIHGTTVPHAPCIMRTSILKENNIQYRNDHPHMEDYDLFFRMKNITNFENLKDILYLYRITGSNVTVKNNHTRDDRFRKMYKEVLTELEIEATDKNVGTHYEFFQVVPLSYTVEDFAVHIRSLISQNAKLKIYPEKEFVAVLTLIWNVLFCRFIDIDKANQKKFKNAPLKLYLKSRYYYIRKK